MMFSKYSEYRSSIEYFKYRINSWLHGDNVIYIDSLIHSFILFFKVNESDHKTIMYTKVLIPEQLCNGYPTPMAIL